MKFTIYTALAILILQATSVINIASMYTSITDKYGSNLEKLLPSLQSSHENSNLFAEDDLASKNNDSSQKLAARF